MVKEINNKHKYYEKSTTIFYGVAIGNIQLPTTNGTIGRRNKVDNTISVGKRTRLYG